MLHNILEIFNPENHLVIWLISAFLLAFYIAYISYPTILFVAHEKHLIDKPKARSSHSKNIPTMGGIGIFLSLIVVITIAGSMLNTKTMMLIMGAITILFFLGLKDDLLMLSAKKKFVIQLFAALLLIVFTDTRIIGFSGILGIETLPYWISIVFTLFVYILLINAYNFIDGIDGLAGTFAFIVCGIFTALFIVIKDYSLATISVALMGALIAFLRLNFSTKNKIFMGDTGSMIAGFLIAFFTISFICETQNNVSSIYHKSSPALVLAILFYPLVDTLRIIIVRLFILKTSPFRPDKNHIHHRMLNKGYNHVTITIIIAIINIVIVAIAFCLQYLNLNIQIILLLLYGSILYTSVFYIKLQKHLSKNIDFNVRKKYQSLNH